MRAERSGCMRVTPAAALTLLVFLMAGCAAYHVGRRPPADATAAEAGALYASLCERNGTLTGFKALGAIRLLEGGSEKQFRSAWAARRPDRLRVDTLGFAGRPMLSFSSDGTYDYVLSYQEGRLIRRRAGGGNFLDRLVQIPIDAGDLFALLCGRPGKTGAFHGVRLEREPLGVTVLTVWNPANGIQSRVWLDGRQPPRIREIERTDGQGRLIWRADFRQIEDRDGYRVPTDLLLTGPGGTQVWIKTERFWANPAMTADLFVLKAAHH